MFCFTGTNRTHTLRRRLKPFLAGIRHASAFRSLLLLPARQMAVPIGRGYLGKCGRVPLAAEDQACPEARAENVPCQRIANPVREVVPISGCHESAARTGRVNRGAISKLDLPVSLS